MSFLNAILICCSILKIFNPIVFRMYGELQETTTLTTVRVVRTYGGVNRYIFTPIGGSTNPAFFFSGAFFLTNYLFAHRLDNFCSKSLVIFNYRKQIVLSLKTLFKICFFNKLYILAEEQADSGNRIKF